MGQGLRPGIGAAGIDGGVWAGAEPPPLFKYYYEHPKGPEALKEPLTKAL